VPEIEEHVLESLEEHHIVKWTLSELEDLDPTDERFDAKVMVLIESVRHHVKEEERDMFPKVRKALGTSALRSLGERMQEAKEIVPRRPHPRMPDEPPGNVVAGSALALLDLARETVSTVRDQVRARGNGG
jgi:hypothetical protein